MIYPIPQPIGSVTETANDRIAIRGELLREPAYMGHTGYYGAIREWLIQKEKAGVSSVFLDIDSCGGEVSGLSALAHDLRNLKMHTIAHVTGTAASAAYCIASACKEIWAEPDSIIGAIGSYVDAPKKSETVVVSSRTPYKLEGGEQLQVIADESGNRFLMDVAEFRGFDSANLDNVADICGQGKLMTAREALRRGLIDKIIQRDGLEMAEEFKEEVKEETKEAPPQGDEMEQLLDKLIQKLLPQVTEMIEKKFSEITSPQKGPTEEEVKTEKIEESDGCSSERKDNSNIDRAARADVKRLEFALLRKDGKIIEGADEEVASRIYDLDRGLFRKIYDSGSQELLTRFSSGAAPKQTRPKAEEKSLIERIDAYLEEHRGMGYAAAKAAVEKEMGVK